MHWQCAGLWVMQQCGELIVWCRTARFEEGLHARTT